MKFLGSIFFILSLLCSGCVCTEKVCQKASDNPAYALLIPVALPADVVVDPTIGIWYVYQMHGPQGDGSGSH